MTDLGIDGLDEGTRLLGGGAKAFRVGGGAIVASAAVGDAGVAATAGDDTRFRTLPNAEDIKVFLFVKSNFPPPKSA